MFDVDRPGEVGGEDPADAQDELPDGADDLGVQHAVQDVEPLLAGGDAPPPAQAFALADVAAAVVGQRVPELPVGHGEMGADGESAGDRPVQGPADVQGVHLADGQAPAGRGVRVGPPARQIGGARGQVGLGGAAGVHRQVRRVVAFPDAREPGQALAHEHGLGSGDGQHPGGVHGQAVADRVEPGVRGLGVDLCADLREEQLGAGEHIEEPVPRAGALGLVQLSFYGARCGPGPHTGTP